jgi:urease accessory protein
MNQSSETATVSVGGPVGSGKTALISRVVPELHASGLAVGVVATDVTNSEDATALRERLDGVVPADLVVGVVGDPRPETLHCDHLRSFLDSHPELDVVLVESGGDTTSHTAPDWIDFSLFVISVAEGDDIPRKRGPGVVDCDLLVVNKTDLAEHVGANLGTIERDARTVRDGPFVFTNCKTGEGIDAVVNHIEKVAGITSST